mmetsp:Transcript_23274/g.64899  ORF Transcript_23274/g.64899 Transcript_23274/m.64899 type:complete len:125 (+) Transcript_23274:3622-3996(+)
MPYRQQRGTIAVDCLAPKKEMVRLLSSFPSLSQGWKTWKEAGLATQRDTAEHKRNRSHVVRKGHKIHGMAWHGMGYQPLWNEEPHRIPSFSTPQTHVRATSKHAEPSTMYPLRSFAVLLIIDDA